MADRFDVQRVGWVRVEGSVISRESFSRSASQARCDSGSKGERALSGRLLYGWRYHRLGENIVGLAPRDIFLVSVLQIISMPPERSIKHGTSGKCSHGRPRIEIYSRSGNILQLRPRTSTHLLLYGRGISLRPFPHQFPLDLTARQLGYLVHECNSTDQLLVLGNTLLHKSVDILRPNLAFGLVLERDVCARELLVEELYANSSSVGNGVMLEKYGFELGRGDLEGVDLDELRLKSVLDDPQCLSLYCSPPSFDQQSRTIHPC